MVMKIKYLLILVNLFMVASCHHKQSNEPPENDSIVNIREMGIADTTTIGDDDERIVHAKMGDLFEIVTEAEKRLSEKNNSVAP